MSRLSRHSFYVNAALRFIFVFIVGKVVFSLLVTVVQLIAYAMHTVLDWTAGAAARWLIFYDFIGVPAPTYVRVEALVLRIMRPVSQANVLGRNNEGIGGPEVFWVITPRPLGFLTFLWGCISAFTIGLPAVILRVLFLALRSIARINISNIAAVVVAFWLTDLLHVPEFGGDMRLGQVPLPVLVAIGTLLALIFVALNADVRGRAELNKLASVTCRTALHEAVPKILRIAGAYRAIRNLAMSRLDSFPTKPELFELTGREDLCWRLLRLLPLTASLVTESASPLSVKLAQFSEDFIGPQWPPNISRNSIIRSEDILDHDATITRESRKLRKVFNRLYESGMTGKLNKALSLPAWVFLLDLSDRRFGYDAIETICLDTDECWYHYALDKSNSTQLREQWSSLANAAPNDPRLREECIDLSHLLRLTIYNMRSAYWHIAVDEYRLRYLAEAIESSLRPRLFDRIIQFFGK